jgi:hypothetical protein
LLHIAKPETELKAHKAHKARNADQARKIFVGIDAR